MANLAVELKQALARRDLEGASGGIASCLLAQGSGWSVEDVVCTSGPRDRPFEEQHSSVSIAIVVAGSFQYRSGRHSELMTPGSLLLGSPGQCFECGHQHAAGDRCVSFHYSPEFFETLAAEAGLRDTALAFAALRVPPLRETSTLIARTAASLQSHAAAPWEEFALSMAAQTLHVLGRLSPGCSGAPPHTHSRVTRIIRQIDQHPANDFSLSQLAQHAGLSPFHFLRSFQHVTGLTPHQYVLRSRLQKAASQLKLSNAARKETILSVALDCGFGDLSNFNRAFRAEFGLSPSRWRQN